MIKKFNEHRVYPPIAGLNFIKAKIKTTNLTLER